MSMHDDLQAEQPRKQGMSGTAKVLLVLGSIAGVGMLLCCGGGVYLFYKAKDFISISMNPTEIKQRTQEIVQIEVPEGFVPIQGVKIAIPNAMTMKYVVYSKGGNTQSIMMLMEMNKAGMDPAGADAKKQRDEMLQALRQQGQQGGGNQFNTTINEESSETREFTINGKKTEFVFVKGTRPGTAVKARQVVGVFPSKEGVVMLMVIVDEDDYDEAAMERMIKSIRLPGEAAAANSAESDEPTDKKPAEDADSEEADAEEMKGESEKQPAPDSP